MLPNLKVSNFIGQAWGDNAISNGVGYVINNDTELGSSELTQQIRVRAAIYNIGHGPIHIAGLEIPYCACK